MGPFQDLVLERLRDKFWFDFVDSRFLIVYLCLRHSSFTFEALA